jgi:NAD+ kinase
MTVRRVGILYHPKVEATQEKARELRDFVADRKVDAWLCSAWDKEKAQAWLDGTDLLLTVGGDGTILRAAQIVCGTQIPVAGINLGTLGFMTEIPAAEAWQKLPLLLEGDTWLDERAMIQAEVNIAGRNQIFQAMNDIVVARGEIARVIRTEVLIDNQLLTTYVADGVILATATGSTGYVMAAGGPILYPQSPDILLVPVAPHLSQIKSLVLPGTAEIKLNISAVISATASIDGNINIPLASGDTVSVRRSPHKVRFLRVGSQDSFYSSLEEKLKGRKRE